MHMIYKSDLSGIIYAKTNDSMFGGWALIILSCLGAYFMRRVFNIAPLLFLVPALGALALNRWIYRRGPDVLMNI